MKQDKKRKLPHGWRWTSLGDKSLVEIIMGQSPPGETYNKNGIGLPFYQGKADFGTIHPNPTMWCSAPERIAEPNDILMSVRAPVGPTNIASERCCIGRGLAAIRCKAGLSYRYLIWVLRHFDWEGVGSTFEAIRKDEITAMEFPLPPTTDDQIRIANELERKMTETEKMRQAAIRRKEAISAMQGAILREVFPWEEGDELPAGWRWDTIGNNILNDVAVFDKESHTNGTFSYIDITNIDSIGKKVSVVTQIPVKDAPSRAKYIVRENDIIVSTVRPNLNSVALIDRNRDGNICSSGFCVLRLTNGQHPPYYFYFLMSPNFVNTVSKKVQGTMYPAVNDGDIKEFRIPLPLTTNHQISIANGLESKMAEVEMMRQAANKELEALEALPGAILREVFDFGPESGDGDSDKEQVQQ